MTDLELLEMAAKAAGREVWTDIDGNLYTTMNDLIEKPWNPLADDGDALRLAVALKLSVTQMPSEDGDGPCIFVSDEKCTDLAWEEIEEEIERQSAIRRAIVRAAAEIGRNVK